MHHHHHGGSALAEPCRRARSSSRVTARAAAEAVARTHPFEEACERFMPHMRSRCSSASRWKAQLVSAIALAELLARGQPPWLSPRIGSTWGSGHHPGQFPRRSRQSTRRKGHQHRELRRDRRRSNHHVRLAGIQQRRGGSTSVTSSRPTRCSSHSTVRPAQLSRARSARVPPRTQSPPIVTFTKR